MVGVPVGRNHTESNMLVSFLIENTDSQHAADHPDCLNLRDPG